MKRVSKNLTKAVTLSVLLMLPYGITEASENTYTEIIQVGPKKVLDSYDKINNLDGNPIRSNEDDTYIYDFGKEAELNIKARDSYSAKSGNVGIFVNSKGKNVIVKHKLDITVDRNTLSKSMKMYGIYISSDDNLFDRRFGGDITLTQGTAAINIDGDDVLVYGGSGNISVTGNNYYGYTSGIDFDSDSNNVNVYWGTGTIEAKSESNNDREREKIVTAVNMNANNGNRYKKVVLGIINANDYENLSKYDDINLDNFSELVNGLGEVTLTATAKNLSETNKEDVEANGLKMNMGANTVISGITTINATAVDKAGYEEDITTEANGLNFKNYGTAFFQKADITAIAVSENGNDVAANGIKVNVEGNDIQNRIITTYLDKSSVIKAEATGTGTVQAHGIYSIKSGKSTTKAENSLSANGIEITTTTNGGTDVENVGIKASGGTVNINGDAGIKVYVNNAADTNSDVFGIWSSLGGTVNVEGAANITINDDRLDAKKIAVVAGTRDLDENGKPFGEQNTVNLNYHKGGVSVINGDILSGYNGLVNVGTDTTTLSQRSTAGTLTLNGNALAGNGGTLNINLTAGSTWTGRADDYQDADTDDWDVAHSTQFAPQFSNEVTSSGDVNVTLAEGATWNVTGQSWITMLEGNGVVDLTKDEGSDAVHIGTVKGNNTFVVNLKPDGLDTSDMIYVKNGTSDAQTLQINNRDEVLSGMKVGDALRFATVTKAGEGFGNITDGAETFGKSTSINDAGIFNVDFDIIYKDYNEKMEGDLGTDQTYNGGNFSTNKPGQDYVDNVYGGKKDTSEINTLEETTETESNPKHVYIVRNSVTKENKSDAGKTIINMSRANYKNAIYMDRLNKRMGEMRYVNGEEEQGLWVRLRHDRIGQSGDFRSMNTMYEVGYDVKQPTDNGEHRIGMAIDYMRGSTTYDDIMGKGETKRYGLWLYDTWLGEKGHYVDYVAKWGHLSNDFDITAKTTGEKINGDYSNNVFSVSAEYGKKNDMGNNWYFEPQAQLQLARVTGADYVTTQGSKVNVDGINSLIGRAGFRIGRDMDENSTVYLKADLLHEFMGDQTVTAADATGTLREEFENKGTWYDVGFGFAAKMSKNSYAFMDFEKSFGNDNDETYQINAGMQWSF